LLRTAIMTMDPPGEGRHDRFERVRFLVCDVSLPTPNELLNALWGRRILEGHVVGCSRDGEDGDCVVVQLASSGSLVVVPATRLLKGDAQVLSRPRRHFYGSKIKNGGISR
jgi:hypothetical protein